MTEEKMEELAKKRKTQMKEKEESFYEKQKNISRVEYLSSGSTNLNLAGTAGKNPFGCWARGRVINIVGDKSVGKSIIAVETLFQAWADLPESKIFPNTKKMKLIYNNVEGVMDFPLETMYDSNFVNSVDWRGKQTIEDTAEDLFYEIKSLPKDTGLIYVIDSWDALKDRDGLISEKKVDKIKTKESASSQGGYNLQKQKYSSQFFFPNLCDLQEDNKMDVTVIIISQTRQKINSPFNEKVRTGGASLDFYSHQIAWFAFKEKETRTYLGQSRVVSVKSKAVFKKNKTARPWREAEFRILFDHGVDDIGSLLEFSISGEITADKLNDFLGNVYFKVNLSEAQKKKMKSEDLKAFEERNKKAIEVPDKKIPLEGWVSIFEDNNLESVLILKATQFFRKVEDYLSPKRKSKVFEAETKKKAKEDIKKELSL